MKNSFVFLSLFFLVSCSSADKTPEIIEKKETQQSAATIVKEAPQTVNKLSNKGLPEITGESISDTNCAMGQDKRVISILKRSDAKGWGVVYNKFGTVKTIAVAQNDRSFCDEVVARVKRKLLSAGFQCDGEISSSTSPFSGDKVEKRVNKMSETIEGVKNTTVESVEGK